MNFRLLIRNFVCQILIFAILSTQLIQSTPPVLSAPAIEKYALVTLLVEESLWADNTDYTGLSDEFGSVSPSTLRFRIERYARSIQASLPLTKVSIILTNKNESVLNIASQLENLYRQGDGTVGEINSLAGVVIIGDLPLPVVKKGDNRFPSLYPYTDFDDKLYVYNANSQSFELSNTVQNPQVEIWHGVINPPKTGAEGSEMLAIYFDKNHLYRSGEAKYSNFDQELFYGDLNREVQSLNAENFSKYENIQEYAYEKMYFNGNKKLAENLYNKASKSAFGFGDGLDNDGDGKIDEDPDNNYDDDGDGEKNSPLSGLIDGVDNDGDGQIDEDDERNFGLYKIADGIDNDGNGQVDEGIDEDNGDPYLGVDNDLDGKIDEDDESDNDADSDGLKDEDRQGDMNNDGCPGVCLVDDDGDQIDSDGDFFPDGAEKEAGTDDRDPGDYPNIGQFFGVFKIPNFIPDPNRNNPNYQNPVRKNWVDEYPSLSDRNCYDSSGKFHPEWDDDEDGFCNEDGLEDNDKDKDGKIDEDKKNSGESLPTSAFEKLPDIAAQRVIGNYLADYPELLTKYIGQINKLTAYSGRWKNSQQANVNDFSSLIGKRDAANRLYFLLVNTALEKVIDSVAEKAQAKTPIIISARIAQVEVTLNQGGQDLVLPIQAPNVEFWSGNNDRINGISYEEISNPLECSLFRGTSSKSELGSQLVLFNKVYNPIIPSDSNGKPIEENEGDYGWCVGKYYSSPEVCVPEQASKQVLDFSGARGEKISDNWFESFTDYRACFDLKEKQNFQSLTSGNADLLIDGRTVKSIPVYRDIVKRNFEKTKELQECLNNNKDNTSACSNITVPALTRPENRPNFLDRYKPLDEIVIFSQSGNNPLTITLADIAKELGIDEKDFISLNEKLFNTYSAGQVTKSVEIPVKNISGVSKIKINIDKIDYAKKGGFLFIGGQPLEISTLVKHKAPFSHEGKQSPAAYDVDWVLSKQSESLVSEALPIDNPRYLTFLDKNKKLQKIIYPNFFSSTNAEDAQKKVREIANDLANLTGDPLDAKKITDVFDNFISPPQGFDPNSEISQLITNGVITSDKEQELKDISKYIFGSLSENISWRDKNIDQKHQEIFLSYLSIKDNLSSNIKWKRLPPVAKSNEANINSKDVLEFNRSLILESKPFASENGYEAAYLVLDGSSDEIEYSINPLIPEEEEDGVFKFPQILPTPTPSLNAPSSNLDDETAIIIFAWFEHIIEWIKSLKFEPSITLRCQYEGNELLDELAKQFAQEQGKTNSSTDEERVFAAATKPEDKDRDGIPDAALKTSSLKIESDEKVLLADASSTATIIVTGLENNSRNFQDGYSQIELQILSGSNYAQVISENPRSLSGGRAEFVISSTDSPGEIILKAVTKNRNQNLSSTELKIFTTDRRIKVSTFTKEQNLRGVSDQLSRVLSSAIIYDQNDQMLAKINSQNGQIEIIDSDYQIEIQPSVKSEPLKAYLVNSRNKLKVAVIIYAPIFSSLSKAESTLPSINNNSKQGGLFYKILSSENYKVEESEDSLKFSEKNLTKISVTKQGQVFIDENFKIKIKNNLTSSDYQTFIISNEKNQDLLEFSIISDFSNLTIIDNQKLVDGLISKKINQNIGPIYGPFPEKEFGNNQFKLFSIASVKAAEKQFDTDEDGLTDLEEFLIGTSLTATDTDGDGESDYQEIYKNSNPLKKNEVLFSDLNNKDDYFPAVVNLYLKGIIRGYADSTFKPNQKITREEFVKLNFATACIDCTRFSEPIIKSVTDLYNNSPFPDDNINQDLLMCVADAKNKSIVSGYAGDINKGFFLPTQSITRAEATKVILLTAGLSIPENPIQNKPWFYNYVLGAKQANLYPKNIFSNLDNDSINEFKSWFDGQIQSDGNFLKWLNEPITRVEFVQMVDAIFKIKNCYAQDNDSDGLSNYAEENQFATDPNKFDTDDGGISDYQEIISGLNPLNAEDDKNFVSRDGDTDGDGLKDIEELEIGTDPYNPDTDNGGIGDYEEVIILKSKPLDPTDDSLIDSDNDGLTNLEEIKIGTDPYKPDTDNGGVGDYEEVKVYKTDPLNSADDNALKIRSDLSGFIAASYYIKYEVLNLPGDNQISSLGDPIFYTDEIPADGNSSLYVRAEIQNLLGETISGDNSTKITFKSVPGTESLTEFVESNNVNVVYGRGDSKIKAKTKSGTYKIYAEGIDENLPSNIAEVNIYSGEPESISFTVDSNLIKADALSRVPVSLNLLDKFGNLADSSVYKVSMRIEGSGVAEGISDEDPSQEGINFTVINGRKDFFIKSTTTPGEIKLLAGYENENKKIILGSTSIQAVKNLTLSVSTNVNNNTLSADGNSFAELKISALDENGNLLSTYSGQVNLEINNNNLGKLTSNKINIVNGLGTTNFLVGNKSGNIEIIATSPIFEPGKINLNLEAPSTPAQLKIFPDLLKLNANAKEKFHIKVKLYDANNNEIKNINSGKIDVRSTASTSKFISFPEGNSFEIKNGEAKIAISPTGITGPINLVFSYPGVPSSGIELESVNKISAQNFYQNPPSSFHITLLGTDGGAEYKSDYLAGSMLFGRGKTQAVTSLLTKPKLYESVLEIANNGKIDFLNEAKLEKVLITKDSEPPLIEFLDPETKALKLSYSKFFDDKSLLEFYDGGDLKTKKSGIYVKLLKDNLTKISQKDKITLGGNSGALIEIYKNGAFKKLASGIYITESETDPALKINSSTEGEIALIYYHTGSSEITLLKNNDPLPSSTSSYLRVSDDLSPYNVETIFNGISSKENGGLKITDTRYADTSLNAPGTSYISLEDSSTREAVGFGEGNKHMLLLASGEIIGAANKPYASEIGVVIGDPTLSLNTPNQISKTGYTKDIGIQILANNEEIQSLTEIDFNGDGLQDVLAAYESGSVVLLENQLSLERFKNRGSVLYLSNGIKNIQKADLDKDGWEDLLIVSKDSCKQEEVCVYWYKNNKGKFESQNLNLKTTKDIADLEVVDLNQDGFLDLVLSDFENNITAFYSKNGNIETQGQLIASLNLDIDEKLNLINGVAIRYQGMKEREENNVSDSFNYIDLPLTISDQTKNQSAEASAINSLTENNNFKITKSDPTTSNLYTFIYADLDENFSSSIKSAKDLNGYPLNDGDEIQYEIELKNSGAKDISDLWLTDIIPPGSTLNLDSIKCQNCSQKISVIKIEDDQRPYVLKNISLPANSQRNIFYSIKIETELPKYQLLVGNNLVPGYKQDNYPDILVKPENNNSGRVLVYYSDQIDSEGKVVYGKFLSTPQPANFGQQLPFTDSNGNPDFGANNADGVPEKVSAEAKKIVGDSDGDLIPDFLDFSNGNLNLDISKISDSFNKAMEDAGKKIEDTIKSLQCGGSCLPFPISVSWLSPGMFNLFGTPVGFDPGTPIVGAVIPSPPFVCFGQACYASTIFRLYVSPTVPPANLGIGLCLGAYPGGQCWAFSVDLLKALNLCEQINKSISDAIATVDTAISSLSGNLVIMGGSNSSSNSANARENSFGINNSNLGKFQVNIPQKTNYRISGFPKPITDWFSKQTDEIVDKLSDLPDVHIILPDLPQAFIPQSKLQSPQNLRDILTWLNSIPILEIETKRVSLKVPVVSISSITAFEQDALQWVENLKSQLKLNQANLRPNIILSVEKLLSQVEHNISMVQEYKKLFKKIRDFRTAQSKYISQVICYIDAIHEMLVGWIKNNEQRIKLWNKAIEDIKLKFTDWKLIIDIPMSYVESCDTCQTERFTLTELIAKLFVVVPTPPIIQLPKWPDIILDFSQIEAGVKIVWPEIDFQPVAIQLPKLPQLDLTSPRLTASFDAGQKFPDIPLLPAPPEFPTLPNLPPLPVINLPVLPRPPEIPGIHPSLKVSLKGIKFAFRILCLIKSGLIPTQETQLKTRFEQLAARNLDAVLPIDTALKINWPNINYNYIDSIEIKGRLNFAPNITINPIYEEVRKFAETINKNVDQGVETINKDLDLFNQLMQGIFSVPSQSIPSSLDVNLNKLFYNHPNKDPNRFSSVLAQNNVLADSCNSTYLENINPHNPAVQIAESSYLNSIKQIEKIAAIINEENKAVPESLSSVGKTIAYIPSSDPLLNKDHSQLAYYNEYFEDAPTLNHLTKLRNSLLTYARNFDQQTENFERSNDLNSAIAYFNQSDNQLTASVSEFSSYKNSGEKEFKFELTEEKNQLKNIGRKTLIAQTNSNQNQGFSQTNSSQNSNQNTPVYDQNIEGIFIYNSLLNINERLVDYLGEVNKKPQIIDIDFDNDGDYDKVYSYGGDIYLKENFLKNTQKQYYSGQTSIKRMSEFTALPPAQNNFKVSETGNRNISLTWEKTQNATGYEISVYQNPEEVYLSTGKALYNFHVLDFAKQDSSKSGAAQYIISKIGDNIKLDGALRITLSKTKTSVSESDLIYALSDSEIIIEDDTENPVLIKEGNYFSFSEYNFSTDDPNVYLDNGSAVLIKKDSIIPSQDLETETLILPEETIQIPSGEEITLQYESARSPIIRGPAIVKFKNLEDPERPAIDINLANGNYYSVIRSFNSVGDLSFPSQTLLLSPQICSDKNPPVANAGQSNREVPLYAKLLLDAAQSFDADSPVTGYYWDLDLNVDSNLDGDFENDKDYFKDKNVLVDSNFDGDPSNDFSDSQIILGPYNSLGVRKVALNVIDEVGNIAKQIITINVIEPKIDLKINNEINGLSGKVTPENPDIPVTLLRKRGDEAWVKVSTISSDKNGNYITEIDGSYSIADFNNKEVFSLKDSQNNEIATINPTTGKIDINDNQNYFVQVLPAEQDKSTRIEIKNAAGKIISTTYLIVDPNTDVKIAPSSLYFDKNSLQSLIGIHVKPLTNGYEFKNIPGDDLIYGGGVSISANEKLLARVTPDGNVYLYQNTLSLSLKKQLGEDDPLVIYINDSSQSIAEIFFDLDLSNPINLQRNNKGIIQKPEYKPAEINSKLDRDGDGMPDIFELIYGFDTLNFADANLDADGDGLTNVEEYRNNTNPLKTDTDSDSRSDFDELNQKSSPLISPQKPFADISSNSNLYEITNKLYNYGYIEGYKNNGSSQFKPDQEISRAEYTKIMLAILCIEPRSESYSKPDVFSDVSLISENNPWYFAITKEAKIRDLITGYLQELDPQTKLSPFKPEQNITLAEAVKIILEALEKERIISLENVKALENEVWYSPFIRAATALDSYIINPNIKIKNTYIVTETEAANPGKKITRGDFATIVSRVLEVRNCYEDDNNLNGIPDGWERKNKIDIPESDLDGDGLDNRLEYKLFSDPNNPDTDGGGVKDGEEYFRGSNILNADDDKNNDRDGDGLLDNDELTKYFTDPDNPDTDGGGVNDGEEVFSGTNPLFAKDDFDRDLDGLTNNEEQFQYLTDPDNPDTDYGGIGDGVEVVRGTDPLNQADDDVDPRDKLPLGVNFTIPQCFSCPCEVSLENKAHLLDGDQVMTVIYNEQTQTIYARSNLIEIK